jgi:hypothetical protein
MCKSCAWFCRIGKSYFPRATKRSLGRVHNATDRLGASRRATHSRLPHRVRRCSLECTIALSSISEGDRTILARCDQPVTTRVRGPSAACCPRPHCSGLRAANRQSRSSPLRSRKRRISDLARSLRTSPPFLAARSRFVETAGLADPSTEKGPFQC